MINTIFLGDRRIAWNAYKRIRSSEFSRIFNVVCIVTSSDMYEAVCLHYPDQLPPFFISNSKRNFNLILEAISNFNIDLLLSFQYSWILPPVILNKLRLGSFNLHNAKLPDYKGYNSISHSILNDDKSYTSTIHSLVSEVDAGSILFEETIPIDPYETAMSLYINTLSSCDVVTKKLLRSFDNNTTPYHPSAVNSDSGRFYSKSEISQLAKLPSPASQDLHERIIRACYIPPYNCAYTEASNGSKTFYAPSGSITTPSAYPDFLRHYD